MFELDNLHKSSEHVQEIENVSQVEIQTPQVYFNREKALRDFDRETEVSQARNFGGSLDEKAATLLANARVLFKHKEYPLALNLLRNASNHDSKNVSILSLLAECLEKTLRLEEALKVRNVIVRIDCHFDQVQKLATLHYKLGQDELASGKYFEALSMLTEENEAIFEIYKNLGNILVRQGDFEGAEEYYNKAYTINPQSDTLLVNFGTLEVQRQDYDKSLYCFRQAVEVNKKNDKAWVGLAMVHSQMGDQELAWANLETALDINPSNRTAVHLISNWGLRDNRCAQSIAVLQAYLGDVEFDEGLSLVLINLYCGNSQITEAQLECERVLLWNPKNIEVAELKSKLKKIKKA
ncbi:MAG: tetratricopeptide repeat protein [Bdellovibrionaceae bacterium]|nr:tetratricopeptide repeat protein [Pseudobdellovibrionaceae bacterium]